MKDLIERQAALDIIQNNIDGMQINAQYHADVVRQNVEMMKHGMELALVLVKALPSVQPLVIHCTDCEDWHKSQNVWNVVISELPSAQPEPCEDTISRADAIRIASGYCHPANVAKELEKLPSVQPEVTKCRDCKFYTPLNRETKTGICSLLIHQNFGDDWYCAGAERRTDERDKT